MAATLHVDLLHTSIDDFIGHFERALGFDQRPFDPKAPRYHLGDSSHVFLGDVDNVLLFWGHGGPNDWDRINAVKARHSPEMVVFFLYRTNGDGSSVFWWNVGATHYRRDRLRVWAHESPGCECSARLKAWIERFWTDEKGEDEKGEGVTNLLGKKEPPAPALTPPAPVLPGRAGAAEWMAWLDWYYSQAWGAEVDGSKLEHIAQLTGKALSTVQNKHALYKSGKRFGNKVTEKK